jgi:transcriptional regulator with XRE-family HTH domain
MTTFRDRLLMVIGDAEPTPWAVEHEISPAGMSDWLNKGRRPYPKTLARLAEKTGIPADWWLNGEGPPPLPGTHQSNAISLSVCEPRSHESKYRDEAALPKADGQQGALKAVTMAPSVAFATRAILAMQRLDWLPPTLDDGARASLADRLFKLLSLESAGNPAMFDRLVDSDQVMEAALRYLWEVERYRYGPESAFSW